MEYCQSAKEIGNMFYIYQYWNVTIHDVVYVSVFFFFRKDRSFRALEALLSEALPVLVHKPSLQVLAANYCTLGLMIGRLKSAPASGENMFLFRLQLDCRESSNLAQRSSWSHEQIDSNFWSQVLLPQ